MSSALIAELDSLIQVLESQLPGSMASPTNRKLENSFKKSMAEYFEGLLKAFPFYRLEKLYLQNAKEVSTIPAVPSGEDWLNPLLNAFQADLLYRVNSHTAAIYLAGSTQMTSYGKTKQLGKPIYYEGPPMRQAVEWAEKHCAELVTRMNEETKTRLAQVISDGIQNKRGIEGLARDIRKEFDDMSKTRSKLIAQTETNTALSTGSFDRMKAMGVTGKQWITVGDSKVRPAHQRNEEAGVIPIDQPFPDGSMIVPGVDPFGCRCTLSPAMLNQQD